MVLRIGIDIGFGFVKGVLEDSQVMFPSVISPLDALKVGMVQEGADLHGLVIALKDGCQTDVYRVGEDAIRQGYAPLSTLHRSRTRSREMAVLFAAALGLLVKDRKDPLDPDRPIPAMVVTGLPVMDYADREWMEEEFRKRHVININGEVVTVDVKRLCIIPQPYGSYFDLAVRADGGDPRLVEGSVGVVDIGYLTTDLITVHDRQYVAKLSLSVSEGMSTVYRRCAQILAGHFPVDVTERNVESILRDGVQTMGATHPVDQALVAHVFRDFAETVRAKMVSLWGKEHIKTLVLSGGGGAALEGHLREHFPHIVMPDDPQWSNVRGYKKFAQYLR
jgi:plasmid segregation protein ParM